MPQRIPRSALFTVERSLRVLETPALCHDFLGAPLALAPFLLLIASTLGQGMHKGRKSLGGFSPRASFLLNSGSICVTIREGLYPLAPNNGAPRRRGIPRSRTIWPGQSRPLRRLPRADVLLLAIDQGREDVARCS